MSPHSSAPGKHGYDGVMASPKYLDYSDVAKKLGVTVPVARKYLAESRRRSEAGINEPKDMPEPDHVFGQSPAWKESTIDSWIKRRPGRGSGGGRKPKTKPKVSA